MIIDDFESLYSKSYPEYLDFINEHNFERNSMTLILFLMNKLLGGLKDAE